MPFEVKAAPVIVSEVPLPPCVGEMDIIVNDGPGGGGGGGGGVGSFCREHPTTTKINKKLLKIILTCSIVSQCLNQNTKF